MWISGWIPSLWTRLQRSPFDLFSNASSCEKCVRLKRGSDEGRRRVRAPEIMETTKYLANGTTHSSSRKKEHMLLHPQYCWWTHPTFTISTIREPSKSNFGFSTQDIWLKNRSQRGVFSEEWQELALEECKIRFTIFDEWFPRELLQTAVVPSLHTTAFISRRKNHQCCHSIVVVWIMMLLAIK